MTEKESEEIQVILLQMQETLDQILDELTKINKWTDLFYPVPAKEKTDKQIDPGFYKEAEWGMSPLDPRKNHDA